MGTNELLYVIIKILPSFCKRARDESEWKKIKQKIKMTLSAFASEHNSNMKIRCSGKYVVR